MNVLFWALTVGVVGKILLAAGVLLAHSALAHEHRVDGLVIRAFRFEHAITLIGIALIVVGYFLEIYFYGFTPLHDCDLNTCGAALNAALQ